MAITLRQSFVFILLLFIASSAFAKNSQDSLLTHLQRYSQLTGQFTQVISSEEGGHTQSSTGEFWIKKPGQFRWHYLTPYVQTIISNGEKLWIYDEDLEQLSIKRAADSINASPLAVIIGTTALNELFIINELPTQGGIEWLTLIPKAESSGFEYVDIGFKNGMLNRMTFQDSFGQTTQLLFSDITVHSPIDDEIFNFDIPNGTDVFDETVQQ